MKQAITALLIQVEITNYDDDGKVLPRPQPVQFPAFEAEIPEAVLEWVRQRLQRPGGV